MPRQRRNLTADEIQQVEKLAAVLRLDDIADFLGISERTLRNRITEDPKVGAAYKRGRQRAIAGVATSLLQQARDGNLTAMIFYLKTQAGWRETRHVEANVTNGALVIDLVTDDDQN